MSSSISSPRFSLLMPSYNAETYIDEAISSGLSALGPEDELIIQDGNSSDSTCEIVRRHAEQDPRILFESTEDQGQSDALNRALARASGDYVGWLNADDLITGEGLAAIRSELESRDYPMIGTGDHSIVSASGSRIRLYQTCALQRSKLYSRGCYVFSGSMFVRTEILRRIGGFSTEYNYCMDLDVMLTLVEQSDFTQAHIPVVIGSLRWHDESKSGGQGAHFISDGWKVRRAHRRALSDTWLSAYALTILSASIYSTRLRHSSLYLKLRGERKIWR